MSTAQPEDGTSFASRRRAGPRLAGGLLGAYSVLVYVFLFLPIAVLVVMSFNTASVGRFPVVGLTGDWYARLTGETQLLDSATFSLIVACATVVTTVPLGLLGAFGLVRFRFRGQAIFTGLIVLPLMVPQLLVGISMLTMFHRIGLPTSLFTVLLGHSALALPYTTLIIAARLKGLDPSLEEAAASLGASRIAVMRRVVLPLLAPGLLGAALFAFTISLGEIIITFFVSGFQQTLPLQIYSLLKIGITPTVNAISVLMMLVGVLAVMAGLAVTRGRDDRARKRQVTEGEGQRD